MIQLSVCDHPKVTLTGALNIKIYLIQFPENSDSIEMTITMKDNVRT